jgi:hypothetical protein
LALGGSRKPSSVVNAVQLIRYKMGLDLYRDPYEVLEQLLEARPQIVLNGTASPLEIFESLNELFA